LLSLTGKKKWSGLVELDVLHEQLSPGVRVQSIPGAALKILTPHAAKNVRRQNGILLKNDFVGDLRDARPNSAKKSSSSRLRLLASVLTVLAPHLLFDVSTCT
jgi:hypothetical protein